MCELSTNATLWPAAAMAWVRGVPPWPEPMTMLWNLEGERCAIFLEITMELDVESLVFLLVLLTNFLVKLKVLVNEIHNETGARKSIDEDLT